MGFGKSFSLGGWFTPPWGGGGLQGEDEGERDHGRARDPLDRRDRVPEGDEAAGDAEHRGEGEERGGPHRPDLAEADVEEPDRDAVDDDPDEEEETEVRGDEGGRGACGRHRGEQERGSEEALRADEGRDGVAAREDSRYVVVHA